MFICDLNLAVFRRIDSRPFQEEYIYGLQICINGSAKEVISWSGACVDGKAVGVGTLVATDVDGLAVVFNGEMKSGKMDGWGTMKFRNDETGEFDRYIGNFENSTPKGNGIYDSSEGWRLQGFFDGAFDSGDGTLYLDQDDAVIRGEFKDGELVGDAFMFYETPEGEMYFGDTETAATGTEDVDKQKQEAGFPPPL